MLWRTSAIVGSLRARFVFGGVVNDAVVSATASAPRVESRTITTSGGRSSQRQYWTLLAVLGAVYLIIYGWLLVASNGMPFVIDNNESFSALTHAANLFHFGLGTSFGLTDEAYGLNPAAHPYVHTHQGDFPRVFAFLLYVLGARSIEAQIVLTTFTIGVIAVYFAYHYFTKIGTPSFAFITCLVFMTDYIFFAQWQVVTYRVWHAFFFFGALVCAHAIVGRRKRLWAGLTVVLYACLFYYEYIYVAYLALLVGAYCAWLYRAQVRVLFLAWLSQLAGALIGIGILLVQLVAFLGVASTIQDLDLTYVARNDAATSPGLQAALEDFYQSHNIVFFYNLVDGSHLRGLRETLQPLFDYQFEAYTPLLTLLFGILVSGWLIGFVTSGQLTAHIRTVCRGLWVAAVPDRWSGPFQVAQVAAKVCLVWVSIYVVLGNILGDRSFLGLPLTRVGLWNLQQSGSMAAFVCGAICTLAFGRVISGSWRGFRQVGWANVLRGCALFWLCTAAMRTQGTFYGQGHSDLWLTVLELWQPEALIAAAVVAAVGIAGSFAALGTKRALGPGGPGLSGLVALLICGCLSYAVVYTLSPGYVLTGYLQRWAPFAVFVLDAAIGLAFYLLWRVGVGFVHQLASVYRSPDAVFARRALPLHSSLLRRGLSRTLVSATAPLLGVVLVGSVAVFTVVDWGHTQLTYLALLPPTHFAFLKDLGQPPFRSASFVANTYAAPIAYFTGEWAYSDALISSAKLTLTDSGYSVAQDAKTYLWLADKNDNPEYLRPDYFVCLYQQNLITAWVSLSGRQDSFQLSCSLPIVGNAATPYQWYLHDEVVAKDETPAHSWAIVKLDWDYPPYLISSGGPGPRVNLDVTRGNATTSVRVKYVYGQQDGKAEGPTDVRLYGVRLNGERCLLQQASAQTEFFLAADFQGALEASVVPETSTKAGGETFSAPVKVGSAADGCIDRPGEDGLTALDAAPGASHLSATDPVVSLFGETRTLAVGALVYKSDSTELLRFTRFGFVPVTANEGTRVRLSNVGTWNPVLKQFEGVSVKSVGAHWVLDAVGTPQSNLNPMLQESPSGGNIQDWQVAPTNIGYTVTFAQDSDGPFVHIQATQASPYLVISGLAAPHIDNPSPLSARAQVRAHGSGQLRLTLSQQASQNAPAPIDSTDMAPPSDWAWFGLRASEVQKPSTDTVAVGLVDVKPGDWFDVREVSVFPGLIP